MLSLYIVIIAGLIIMTGILTFMFFTSPPSGFKKTAGVFIIIGILTILLMIWTASASNWFVETTVKTPEQWSNPFEAALTCEQSPAPAPCRIP
jgi:putative copper export protein